MRNWIVKIIVNKNFITYVSNLLDFMFSQNSGEL